MPDSLRGLVALRGRPSRTYCTMRPDGTPEVVARWGCGCTACGPSVDRLELRTTACQVHAPQRSLVTLRLRLPEPPT